MFYTNISEFLSKLGDIPVILGGDWNATYSQAPAQTNINVVNMLSPPSLIRSGWIADLCCTFNLLDPYRAFHPTLRDFTFIPSGARKNRSRLDFFLISDKLLQSCKSCKISSWISVANFDHKSVSIDFSKDKSNKKLFINRSISSNTRTSDVVLGAFADTYLAHADENQVIQDDNVHHHHAHRQIENQKGIVGRFLQLIRDFNDLLERIIKEPNINLFPLQLAGVERDIESQRDLIWSVDKFSQLRLTCDADFFLEALASNIKGSVISFQTFINRLKNLKKSRIVSKLNSLKSDYNANFDRISALEDELNVIINTETLLKVKTMKIFSCLNSERPSPIFLSLARTSNANAQLNSITHINGNPIAGNDDHVEKLVCYFENIYKNTDSSDIISSMGISDFLGEDIVSHPLVTNSKLTQDEYVALDEPLSLAELDKSIDKCNIKSAPGIDGLSNAFIKQYWQFFRVPLFNYATCCYDKGRLTTNVRSASIKLIPKKGDKTDLKNWRPISLLSNLYKIISRAIKMRLNPIVNRICSRAQKGFNDCRFTQECLINVIETIQHCNNNNINGAVVAVDMAKAFDTLSHRFLREVFQFFNMGPTIINWLTLLGENRSACLLLDDGNYSRSFELGRGRAQGVNISPNTFNFGEQILIFKIELDKNITGVWQNFLIPPHIGTNKDPLLMYESRGKTHRNESLADDNTTLMELTENNLRSLRNILDNFGALSGLKCNYDKTMVMPVGNTSRIPRNLYGFSVTNKIKLLGAEITNNWEDLEKNFETVTGKIENLILFWERFRLTLPGRIAIIKTLLVPQLNYLGCFLSPSEDTIKRLQLAIDSFALKGQVVSPDRRYLLPEQGGGWPF